MTNEKGEEKVMKGKKTLCTLLVTMIAFSIMATASATLTVKPWSPLSPGTWLYVEDYEFYDEANLTCTNFNVSVNIYNVTGMKGCGANVGYNNTILEAVRVYETDITDDTTKWLPTDENMTFHFDADPTINNTRTYKTDFSYVWISAWGFTSFTGNGTVFKIEFHIIAAPERDFAPPANKTVSCPLELIGMAEGAQRDLEVLDSMSGPIPFDPDDGSYTYIRPQIVPGAPVAKFDWSPEYPFVDDTVTFDASDSTPNGGSITGYQWDFNGDATWDTAWLTDPTTTHVYTTAATYTVILNITDSEGESDTVESNDATDSMGHDVVVSAKPAALIDVFTIKTWLGNTTLYREKGRLAGVDGSAFGPGETVKLRSIVTFSDLPVMAVWVGFQVDYPDNSTYASMADVTDVMGNATISFRLPLSPVKGEYQVSSTAIVLEMPVKDTLGFNVGWIITITEVTKPAEVTRGTTASFTVTVESIDPYNEYPVVITISVFDYMNQALGTNSTFNMVIGTESETLTLFIIDYPNPGYAWPGAGAYVKANAYTDWPELGGSPYCPEITQYFTILP